MMQPAGYAPVEGAGAAGSARLLSPRPIEGPAQPVGQVCNLPFPRKVGNLPYIQACDFAGPVNFTNGGHKFLAGMRLMLL
jgi:hypothetical protein